ncbi:MAG: hypothetical protein PHZ09_02255 [Eubacteriales bacterium]|jgi:hypothetical protein|nr:hypothetical protein [Eubacteriales bacterium]
MRTTTLRNKIFIGICGSFLLLVMIAAPVRRFLVFKGIVPDMNVGNIIEVDKVYDNDAFMGRFFNAIEEGKRNITDIYTNYIPLYLSVTTATTGIKNTLNEPMTLWLTEKGYDLLQTEAVSAEETQDTAAAVSSETDTDITEESPVPKEPVFLATMRSKDGLHRYYTIKAQMPDGSNYDLLTRVPAESGTALRRRMENQVDKFNKFAEAAEGYGANVYVYMATCLEDTALADKIFPNESHNKLLTSYIDSLSPLIQFGSVKVDTIEDKITKFYLTDHHWNTEGILEAYRDLVSMMRENHDDFSDMLPYEIRTVDGCLYYGSYATAMSSYNFGDPFSFADFDLTAHDLTIETGVPYGGTTTREESKEIYMSGNWNTALTYTHYISFYRIANKIVYPENKTGRNLLMVCDSYSPPMMEIIAYHYDTSYFRYIDSNQNLTNINLADYIAENNITDIVIMQMGTRLLYDLYGDSLYGFILG